MPISLSRKLEFVVTVLLVTVKSIASYKEEEQQGLTECIQIYNDKALIGVEGESGSVVNVGYPGTYSAGPDVPVMCEVALRACNSCRFHIDFQKLQFPACNSSPAIEYTSQQKAENWCLPGCDHIHISEGDQPYNLHSHQNYFSINETTTYDSISSYVRIIHCMSNATLPEGKKFKIIYRVVAKKEEFTGSSSKDDSSSGFLISPNFPHGYALNGEIFLYSIQNIDPKGFIQLVFDDWDVAQESEIQVFDGKLQPPIILKHFERPIIFSNTSSLLLLFHTGSKLSSSCCSYIGFKATFSFVSERNRENIRVDCGATLPTSVGGGISFHGVSSMYGFSYDCVWVIKKIPEEKYNYKIYLHLIELSMKDGWKSDKQNKLEIRNGISSVESLIARYTGSHYSKTQSWNTHDHSQGFYVRLRGNFYRQDKIRFSYTAAGTMTKDGCPDKFKYPCFNILCIALSLKCDGIDHCGDNSDEAPALKCSSSGRGKVKQNLCEGKFLCDNDICLDMSHRCDGIQDCVDGSDEKSCYELSPVNNSWRFSICNKAIHLSIFLHLFKVLI